MSVAHASRQAPATQPRAGSPRPAAIALAAAVTLSAFLLFQVQPVAAKYILPWFGGGAGVWTTCMVFFQLALLAGYLYAHLSVTFLAPRRQAALHAILVAAALATLPIIPAERWKPIDPAADPSPRILLLLLATLGAPYVVLSATAPLLQAWFARLFPGRSPYRLYALSNAASLAALVSFPFAFEPLLSRKGQAHAWSAGYVLLAACLAACMAFLWRGSAVDAASSSPPAPGGPAIESADPTASRTSLAHYVLWLLLPACASLMFLAVTNKLCLDVAPVPFLWILPVSLYLVTFILCFDSDRWYRRWFFGPFLVVALAAAGYALHHDVTLNATPKVSLLCLALFACCMVCHGELAALKPGPRRLTAFYLMIAVGGAAGGTFVGIVAPLVFDQFLELHIGLALTWLLFLAALAANPASRLYAFRRTGWWYLLIIIALLLVAGLYAHVSLRYSGVDMLARVRNFHGVIQVYEWTEKNGRVVTMQHNGITHGMQYLDPGRRMETTTYYHRGSGVGRLLTAYEGRPARIGVVGLGAGTLAGAATGGQVMRFYELDADVERLARGHFTFISGSPAMIEVVLGDARLSMERERPQGYDVLAVDAFSGDAIPVHLLTREAMDVYVRHLKPGGVLALHLSNWHFDLTPVVAGLAHEKGLDVVFVGERNRILWALASHNPASLDPVRPFVTPQSMPTHTRIWTDDYASVFPLLKWR